MAATGHNAEESRNNRMIVQNWSVLLVRMLKSILPLSIEISDDASVSFEVWRAVGDVY